MSQIADKIPVRLYETDDLIMIAAPLPGLEPENIHLRISPDRVVIEGDERGPRQHLRDLMLAEWTVGPYYREVYLPGWVDPKRTNASYGNGVLAISLPKTPTHDGDGTVEITLDPVTSTRGLHVGHTGSDLLPIVPNGNSVLESEAEISPKELAAHGPLEFPGVP